MKITIWFNNGVTIYLDSVEAIELIRGGLRTKTFGNDTVTHKNVLRIQMDYNF